MLDRTIPPKIDGKIKFTLPEIQQTKLKNGSNIYLVTKKDLPIVQLNFSFPAGSKFDPQAKEGLSNLTSYLLDEGAGNLNALQLSDEFEKLGIIFGIGSSQDEMHLSLLTLKEHLDRAVELASMIILKPWLKESEFKREKQKVLGKILQLSARPSYLADAMFIKSCFRNTPYEHPEVGFNSSVDNLALDDVHQFYNKRFSPEEMSIISVGDVDADELSEVITKYFGKWDTNSEMENLSFNFNPDERKLYIINKDDAAQTEIRVGHITSERKDPAHLAKMVVNSILGGSFSSRLNSKLREEKGYTYGIRSSFFFTQKSGLLEISTSVDTENSFNAVNEILNEFSGIRGNIKDEEISFTKSYLTKRFPSLFETYSQITRSINNLVEHDLPLNYYHTYIDRLNGLSKEEILDASVKYFNPEQLSIVLIGNGKEIKKQFADWNEFNIEELTPGEVI